MGRGATAELGTVRTAPNGYQYVKVAERGWILRHWLIWEAANERQVDSKREQIRFRDGNRTNMALANLICVPKGKVQLRSKIARLYVQRDEVLAQIKYYEALLAKQIEAERGNS